MAKDNQGRDVAATPAAASNDDMATMREQMARMQATIEMLLQRQAGPTPDSLWAAQEIRNQKMEAEQERQAAYIGLPSQLRSQYEANRRFDAGKKIFSVLLGTGKKGECPQLFIRADLESDAKARYQDVCNVRYVVPNEAHPEWARYTIADVTNDPAAQKAVSESWQYQPQAA